MRFLLLSILSYRRKVTERFCVEEITDAISALGGITAVGALVGAFYSVSERTLSEQGKGLSFLMIRNSYQFKQESPSFFALLNGRISHTHRIEGIIG